MNYFEISDNPNSYVTFPFYYKNQIIDGPVGGLTLKSAGSMRFRWNEINQKRDYFLCKIQKELTEKNTIYSVPIELTHSKEVYTVNAPQDTFGKTGDGIITTNSNIMPVVTVADCMPLYLFDSKKNVFGIVHSGWKGTGIVVEAIKAAEKTFGSKPEDFSVIIGPHIKSCCYIVNEERAEYFSKNFTDKCIMPLEEGGNCYCGGKGLAVNWNYGNGKLYRLSLEEANLSALRKAGICDDNISICKNCTCCSDFLGSNRRETAMATAKNSESQKIEPLDVSRAFTVMAAFVIDKRK